MPTRTEDLVMLGLDPGGHYSAAEVKAAYRGAARVVHPDKGGAVEQFQRLNEAYKRQLARMAASRCATCRGRGTVVTGRGFQRSTRPCPACRAPKRR